MLIVKPILIVDTEKQTTAEVFLLFFYDLHSMQHRRLNLLTNSERSRVSSFNLDL